MKRDDWILLGALGFAGYVLWKLHHDAQQNPPPATNPPALPPPKTPFAGNTDMGGPDFGIDNPTGGWS